MIISLLDLHVLGEAVDVADILVVIVVGHIIIIVFIIIMINQK